jgi:hypothetical protein
MNSITAAQISRFLSQHPGASISLRKQRVDFSVRITGPHKGPDTGQVFATATSPDIDEATLKAIDTYESSGRNG